MIEPVHFNTEFIYQFGTDGIIQFGGEEDGMIDVCTLTWKQSDIQIANAALQRMKQEKSLPEPHISLYEKNKNGTAKLLADLIEKGDIPNEYLMGCVICHQLTFKVPLEATFMTGEPNSNYNSDNE